MAPPAPIELTGDWVVDENFQPVDISMLTADQIIGANIRNADGETVASVADLVLGADGKAESVAAKFGGFLGFGQQHGAPDARRDRVHAERQRHGGARAAP